MLKDADQRLEALKESLDRFRASFRRMSWTEREALDINRWDATFIPDLRPLGRAATAEDVQTGKAIFHLDGKGTPAALKLPAVAMLKKDAKQERPPRVLIVQAEVDLDGTTVYGVVAKHGLLRVLGQDLTAIKPIEENQK